MDCPGLFFACLSDQILVMLPSTLLWKLVDSFMPDFCCQFLQCIAVRPDGLGDCLELNKYWIKKEHWATPTLSILFWQIQDLLLMGWRSSLACSCSAACQVDCKGHTWQAWLLARSLPSAIQQEERGTLACVNVWCVLIHANVLKLCNRKYSLGRGGGGDGEEFPFINLIMSTCPVRLVDVSKWDVC